jgi:hypothetical protein
MVQPRVARGFVNLADAVLHQCIRPLIGAWCAPGHHGYQRAFGLISGQASNGPFGSPVFACAGKTDPPSSPHPLADLGGYARASQGALLTQVMLPVIADGGSIVNVTSNSAFRSGIAAGASAYAAMKGAMTTLTGYMANEFSRRRIRVNSVAPSATRTRIADDAYAKYPEVIQQIVDTTAMGRLGEANDVGALIAAVLSDDFRRVTGQNMEASGGARLSLAN